VFSAAETGEFPARVECDRMVAPHPGANRTPLVAIRCNAYPTSATVIRALRPLLQGRTTPMVQWGAAVRGRNQFGDW